MCFLVSDFVNNIDCCLIRILFDLWYLSLSPAVVGELASKMLGFNLTTKQTPKDGVKVKTVSHGAD